MNKETCSTSCENEVRTSLGKKLKNGIIGQNKEKASKFNIP
jgi:hypothetical protein